jgi:hypothetical protein
VLYQLEMSGGGLEQALRAFADSFERSPRPRVRRRLVRGVLARREDIDGLIAGASEHWRLERLSRIDANVIRIAVFEMTTTAAADGDCDQRSDRGRGSATARPSRPASSMACSTSSPSASAWSAATGTARRSTIRHNSPCRSSRPPCRLARAARPSALRGQLRRTRRLW